MFHPWRDYRMQLYSRIRFRAEGTNVDQQPATRDNLDWFEFGYRERITRLPCQAKDLRVQHVDHK
jgi:hypothetical protein